MTQTPKDVVRSAYEYLLSVSQSEKISLVRIEELDQNDGFWKVVLSYEVTGEFMFERQRLYKEFSVSDVDCKVLSMKIKQI